MKNEHHKECAWGEIVVMMGNETHPVGSVPVAPYCGARKVACSHRWPLFSRNDKQYKNQKREKILSFLLMAGICSRGPFPHVRECASVLTANPDDRSRICGNVLINEASVPDSLPACAGISICWYCWQEFQTTNPACAFGLVDQFSVADDYSRIYA
jgi:hypothetical protein